MVSSEHLKSTSSAKLTMIRHHFSNDLTILLFNSLLLSLEYLVIPFHRISSCMKTLSLRIYQTEQERKAMTSPW